MFNRLGREGGRSAGGVKTRCVVSCVSTGRGLVSLWRGYTRPQHYTILLVCVEACGIFLFIGEGGK